MSLPAINSHQCHVCMNPRQPVEVQLLSRSSSAPCPNESALPRRPMRSQLLSFSSQALCPHKSALPRRPVESQPVSPPCRQRGLAWIRHAQTACEGQTCLIIGVCPHESALPRRPVGSQLLYFSSQAPCPHESALPRRTVEARQGSLSRRRRRVCMDLPCPDGLLSPS